MGDQALPTQTTVGRERVKAAQRRHYVVQIARPCRGFARETSPPRPTPLPTCWLNIPGICVGTSAEVHHVTPDADEGSDVEFVSGQPNSSGCARRVSARDSAARASLGARVLWEKERHPGILP
ncbi:uncharacterized protein RMCN_2885 [Mycolicibacterium novocastrense]|uniref:Uncharacterized protein n=1 Tax=Mycolicibacterium novocastrense TaxID=59813 RepID=A0ABQ0KJI5_MYCNV|nr:uncharacterized protein RMCN_2885 [Mycolicibacterium novocastrense]